MRWKIIILTVIPFLIVAGIIFYLRTIGILGNLEALFLTIISAFLSSIPSLVLYYLQPKVALKIENVRFSEKQVNHNLGHYLKAIVVNEGKKIGLNINARFNIKDNLGKSPSLLYVTTETINGQKQVSIEEKPFDENIGYAWILDGEYYRKGFLKELRHNEKVNLLFPHQPFSVGTHSRWFESEYLLKLERGKKYEVKITVKGEDSEKNTVEATKKVRIKV